MKFTGYPRAMARDVYACAIEDVLGRLRCEPAVLAVYQVGAVRTPGISDVDLLVIFRDDADCALDPLAGLADAARYVFAHSQFGMPARHFAGAVRFGFFHDYRLLHGTAQQPEGVALAAADREAVDRQAGIEYLLKLFVTMSVERRYGIVKVRNLLLLGRSLRYDLDYVGAGDSRVGSLVDEIVAWREQWFRRRPSDDLLRRWFAEMYRELEALLGELLVRAPLYLPDWVDLRIADNMELRPAARLGVGHRGVTLPAMLGGLGRRYFNLQHRFNRFAFDVPVTRDAAPAVRERHEFIAEMGAYNRRRLPYFNPTPSALTIFRRRATA
jgi:hypothetical protein